MISTSKIAIVFLSLYSCLQLVHAARLSYALFTATEGFDSSGAVPAVELAEEMVNRNNTVLPGYTLVHTAVRDTQCNRARSLDLFFEEISSPTLPLLGLLGCGCSVASTPVAEIIHHRSMVQVAYGSSSLELDDTRRFPNFFRTYPSDTEFTPIVVSVVKHFGWKRIALLSQDEELFIERYRDTETALSKLNITVMNQVIPSELPIKGLSRSSESNFFFEEEDYRVFLINAYSEMAQHIICEAHRRGYTYPRYAWIVYAWYAERWWETPSTVPLSCTSHELAGFLVRVLAIQRYTVTFDENAMTDTGLTGRQFNNLYEMKLNESMYSASFLAAIAHDALWSLAFALHETNQMVEEMTKQEVLSTTGCPEGNSSDWELVQLENFTNNNQLMGCVIRWNLQKTNFTGVSGGVQFNEKGSRFQVASEMFQYRLNENKMIQRDFIAIVDYENNKAIIKFVNNETTDTVYPESEGGIPLDGTATTQINTFSLALVGSYYSLAALGILYCIICLIFNFTQRNKKVVRLTSPNLNYLIIAGACLMYLSVFCRLIPSTSYPANKARCVMEAIVDIIGYCLAFGVVLTKMGRIYYIFNNPHTKKMTVKDWHLVLIIFTITGVGAMLVTLHVAVPSFRPNPLLILNPEYGTTINIQGVSIENMVYGCFEEKSWIIVTFLYLALLQVIGIVLAIQTRNVKVEVLNDSKYIAALIYISSIVLVTRAVAVFAVNHLPSPREAIFSGGIILVSTAFLSLVFIPMMVSLVRDPKGEKIFEKTSDTVVSMTDKNMNLPTEQESTVTQLETKISQLETELEQLKQKSGHEEDVEIEAL